MDSQKKPASTGKDSVNHPPHYVAVKGVECLDVIFELDLPYAIGCAMKYLWRAGRKPHEDLERDLNKAIVYLERYLDFLDQKEE